MPRTRHSVARKKRKKKVFKRAKGFVGGRSKLYRTATETVRRALAYAYRDRKVKKRTFRALWIVRLNAAVKPHGLSYSRFINGLAKAKVNIDRKMLADLAVTDKSAIAELAKIAKAALEEKKTKQVKKEK